MDEAGAWLARLTDALARRDAAGAAALFAADGCWRDLLAMSWTIATFEGRGAIEAMLRDRMAEMEPHGFRVVDGPEAGAGVAWIAFDTALARGTGVLRLQDGEAVTLLTAVADLRGHEEPRGLTRPRGVTHGADRARLTWAEQRKAREEALGGSEEPYVLVVGAGQGGLALGARLRALGVPALLLERNPRVGDSWRNRYRSLVLHDPVWYDHMPDLPFPEGWPVFTPKDRMGDWLEAYARIFDLDVWTSTSADAATFDAVEGRWTVTVTREGTPRTLRPAHLVMATGAYGPPRPVDWPGREAFRGPLLHSSEYRDGRNYAGQRCVVVGAASSAHDVAVDLWEAGADVTLVQRSPTTVVRSDTLMELGFESYSEAAVVRGLTTHHADLLGAASPYARMAAEQRALYDRIRARDAEFYARLSASGFRLDFGEDDSGLMMKALRTASGYYIDVGASELIASGAIKVIAGHGVAGLTPDGLRLDHGREVAADLIVACTGFQSMNEAITGLVSREAADAVGPCWGLGSGVRGDPGPWVGELRNMWRPTAMPHLWFHGGNLALSRFYSRVLALQLKARMEGMPVRVMAVPGGPVADASQAAEVAS